MDTNDAVDLGAANLVGGADVTAWPVTTLITSIDFTATGFGFHFSKQNDGDQLRWPDVVPDGWSGPVQYTIWAGACVQGRWEFAAILNVWYGLFITGGTAIDPEQFSTNLWYLNPTLATHTPVEAEPLAYFVTAGGLRGVSAVSVHERSQVVLVPFSRQPRTVTTYVSPPPVPAPAPLPLPPPTPIPPTPPAPPAQPTRRPRLRSATLWASLLSGVVVTIWRVFHRPKTEKPEKPQ
jgi:hypothetical protein